MLFLYFDYFNMVRILYTILLVTSLNFICVTMVIIIFGDNLSAYFVIGKSKE